MTETPDQLRAAAALLREAASHATPGPWRTHDTHLGSTGGHTATVLTDRPNINDTELVAWLPTMSNEPWDEARNAWRNAGWMALMHPSVGLALADWLDTETATWAGDEVHSPCSTGTCTLDAALVVARQVLGTTTGQLETTPTVTRAEVLREAANGLAALGPLDSLVSAPAAWTEAIETLRRMADQMAEDDRSRLADEAQQPTGCTSAPCPHPDNCRYGCRAAADELTREAQPPTPAEDESCGRFVPDTPRAPGLCASCGDARGWHSLQAVGEQQATPAPAEETDTLPAWLYQRFMSHGAGWDNLDEDDRSYWEHHARAVRRAVARGGFKAPTTPAPAEETK
ncbi:hypothetical protein ACFYNN_13010 [Streptomyces sp. NPDC006978]|uniref:hypothetical protein n=1 Tax=Streptomyces sp. NPDC006978 TaxID=3364769 RepID=UPI00367E4C06